MKHGNERFFIEGEGLINEPLFPGESFDEGSELRGSFPLDLPLKSDEQVPKPTRRFCRLFNKGDQPDAQGLIDLGMCMETEKKPKDDRDSDIPAGYTYLGQFIDHDITLDRDTKLTEGGEVEPVDINNFCTPSLDLDSLYLGGPENNPKLYEKDQKTFKIGKTTKIGDLGVFENDLPRQKLPKPIAIIGDARNDENLAVAQTHLAFLKFHNACAAANPNKSFKELRHEVTLHYQAIILTDFLPRILDQEVLKDVLQNGRKFYTDDKKDCMPIEFSVAAFRLHSMVRPSYQWNRIHNGEQGIATLGQLFEFSGGSGSMNKFPHLRSDWIIDWHRFYDFSEVGGKRHEQLNFARKLDSNMAFGLKELPEFQGIGKQLQSLATRDLLRGRLVSLPNGQEVAAAIGETALSPEDIYKDVEACQVKILKEHCFDKATPLWYYILCEAMVEAGGNRFGRVGSRIIAETFVGLIQNSPINVFSEQPELSFSMPKLLKRIPNDINPLGD